MTATAGATIEQRVDRLEVRMVRSEEDITSISGTVSETLEHVKILRHGQSKLEGRVGMLRIDLHALSDEVAVLQTDVSDVKTDVSQLKTDVSGLKTDVGWLRQAMQTMLDRNA